MTTLREAAQQALEALLNFPSDISDEMFESIRALKAALAQQAEPVDGACLHGVDDGACKECYAANAEAVEQVLLTEEEIEHIGMTHQSLRQVVRAVEAAHGIKE